MLEKIVFIFEVCVERVSSSPSVHMVSYIEGTPLSNRAACIPNDLG